MHDFGGGEFALIYARIFAQIFAEILCANSCNDFWCEMCIVLRRISADFSSTFGA